MLLKCFSAPVRCKVREHGIFNLSSFETFLVFKCFFVRIFFSQKCSVRFKLPPPSPMKSSTSSSKMSTSIIGDDWTKLALATLPRPHQGPPSQRKYLDQSQGTIVVDWFVSWLSFNKYFFSKLILVCDCWVPSSQSLLCHIHHKNMMFCHAAWSGGCREEVRLWSFCHTHCRGVWSSLFQCILSTGMMKTNSTQNSYSLSPNMHL